MNDQQIRAVLWDFGGVILTSPFEAFARYELENGLPDGFLRGLNATNPHDNAWARLERSEVDLAGFSALFEAEAEAAGHRVDARQVLALLSGEVRPEMLEALRRLRAAEFLLGLLTNNFVSGPGTGMSAVRPEITEVIDLFDTVVESSKVGVRKPDPRFYEMACAELGIVPAEAVFLDDLGVNLKPARAMGMHTIKVIEPRAAIAELESIVQIPLT